MAVDGGSPLGEVRAPFWPTSEGLFRSSPRFTPQPVAGKCGGSSAKALHALRSGAAGILPVLARCAGRMSAQPRAKHEKLLTQTHRHRTSCGFAACDSRAIRATRRVDHFEKIAVTTTKAFLFGFAPSQ